MSSSISVRIRRIAGFLLLVSFAVTVLLYPVLSSAATQEPAKPGTAAPAPGNPPANPPANPPMTPPAPPPAGSEPENPILPGDCGG